jgi:hypothetical protein
VRRNPHTARPPTLDHFPDRRILLVLCLRPLASSAPHPESLLNLRIGALFAQESLDYGAHHLCARRAFEESERGKHICVRRIQADIHLRCTAPSGRRHTYMLASRV